MIASSHCVDTEAAHLTGPIKAIDLDWLACQGLNGVTLHFDFLPVMHAVLACLKCLGVALADLGLSLVSGSFFHITLRSFARIQFQAGEASVPGPSWRQARRTLFFDSAGKLLSPFG